MPVAGTVWSGAGDTGASGTGVDGALGNIVPSGSVVCNEVAGWATGAATGGADCWDDVGVANELACGRSMSNGLLARMLTLARNMAIVRATAAAASPSHSLPNALRRASNACSICIHPFLIGCSSYDQHEARGSAVS